MNDRDEYEFVGIDQWPLAYRFNDARWNRLPDDALATIRPLADASARRLAEAHQLDRLVALTPIDDRSSSAWRWHDVDDDDPGRTRDWLRSLRPDADGDVFVEWYVRDGCAAVASWRTFCAYFDDFCYPSDIVLVCDETRSWQVLLGRNHVVRYRLTRPEDWDIPLPGGFPLPGSAELDVRRYDEMKARGTTIAEVDAALRRDGVSHLESIRTLRRFGASFEEACSLVLGVVPPPAPPK